MIDINTIWEKQLSSNSNIITKKRIREIVDFECFIAVNNITKQRILILSVSKEVVIPDLRNYRFIGIEIFVLPDTNKNEIYIYLLDNDLKDVFSLFIQNVLEGIQRNIAKKEVIETILIVISKWKKLFEKISLKALTSQQQKGLVGELLFLKALLDHPKMNGHAVSYWTSTEIELQSKDFILENFGVEVKFTTAKQPKIRISNERQLDIGSLKNLFLVLYTAEEVKNGGISLNSIIQEIRQKLFIKEHLELFNAKLQLNGYFDKDTDVYTKKYFLKEIFAFEITPNFPKITKNDLSPGVYDVSYSIEISAIESYKIPFEEIFLNFNDGKSIRELYR